MNRVTARVRTTRNDRNIRRLCGIGLAIAACMPLAAAAQDSVLKRLAENTRLTELIERVNNRPQEPHGGIPVIRVGNDPDCDYTASTTSHGLQLAMDAAAIDANGADLTEIRVADTGNYLGRRYFLNDAFGGDQTVDIIGGYATCASASPSGNTVLDRAGGSGPVIAIDPAASPQTVTLVNLTIQGAEGTGPAGGVQVGDNNDLVLDDTTVQANTGDRGGGIRFVAGAGGASALVVGNSRIRSNTALTSGGGIYCSGANATVILDGAAAVNNNTSNFDGGGFHADAGCTLVSLSSFPAGIFGNLAIGNGGGGTVTSGASATLFGGSVFGLGNADATTLLDLNQANNAGGGFHITGAGSLVDVQNAWVSGNVADADENEIGSGGAALVLDGAEFRTRRTLAGDDCADPVRCTRVNNNFGRFGGGIFAAGDGTRVDMRQTWIEANQAPVVGSAVMITNNGGDPAMPAELFMEGNMIVNNPTSNQGTVDLQLNTTATIAFTTFADNLIDAGGTNIILFEDVELGVYSSILWESTGLGIHATNGWEGPNSGIVDCLITFQTSGLPPASSFVTNGDPLFTAPGPEGDYRLGPGSPAIDYCDTAFYNPVEEDIEGMPRGFDVPSMPNILGPMDLGAHEYASTIAGGTVQFRASIVEAVEDIGTKVIEITRTGGSEGPASYLLETVDGTAVAGTDYTAVSQALDWADGETGPRIVEIPIIDNAVAEPDRQFRVQLARAGGAAEAGAPANLLVVIIDNDGDWLFSDGFED